MSAAPFFKLPNRLPGNPGAGGGPYRYTAGKLGLERTPETTLLGQSKNVVIFNMFAGNTWRMFWKTSPNTRKTELKLTLKTTSLDMQKNTLQNFAEHILRFFFSRFCALPCTSQVFTLWVCHWDSICMFGKHLIHCRVGSFALPISHRFGSGAADMSGYNFQKKNVKTRPGNCFFLQLPHGPHNRPS